MDTVNGEIHSIICSEYIKTRPSKNKGFTIIEYMSFDGRVLASCSVIDDEVNDFVKLLVKGIKRVQGSLVSVDSKTLSRQLLNYKLEEKWESVDMKKFRVQVTLENGRTVILEKEDNKDADKIRIIKDIVIRIKDAQKYNDGFLYLVTEKDDYISMNFSNVSELRMATEPVLESSYRFAENQ